MTHALGSPRDASRSFRRAFVIAAVLAASVALAAAEEADTDAFVATGSMPSFLEQHGGELLLSGKVLIAGGSSFSPGPAYLFDPVAGGFSTTGTMGVAPGRTGHTLTLLGSGKVLVAGGSDPFNGGVTLNSAQLYNAASGTFAATSGNMVGARRDHTASLLSSGKVLLAGGQASFTNLATAELYDPAANTFAATGPLATARYAHVAAVLPNGKVLVAGGFGNAGVLASAEIYDPVAGTWSPTGGLATARYLASAVALADGRVLVAGGRGVGPSFSFLASAEIYDPAAGTFSAAGPMAAARVGHRVVLLQDGRALVVGGGTTGSTVAPATPSSELFNPSTGAFTAGPAMITPRLFHTATRLSDGRVLVAGGERPSQVLSSAELFVPAPPVAPASVVINEISYDPDGSSPDPLASHEWVELFNKGGSPAPLAGWILSDRGGRLGGGTRALPSVDLPAGAYLTIHLSVGVNDLDFTDGSGEYYTGDAPATDLFAAAMDEAALYDQSGAIVDFVVWNRGASGYLPGTAHNDAVAAGQWTSGLFLNTDRLTHSPAEKWRTVVKGTTIGRDASSHDTNLPDDWDAGGGQDSGARSPGGKNLELKSLVAAPDDGPHPGTKTWTVMVYMVGDNDLEKRTFEDLKEIEQGGGSSADVNFVVMVDGREMLNQYTLDAQNQLVLVPNTKGHTWRFQLAANPDDRYIKMHTHQYNPDLGERDMGDPGELSGFIAWAKQNYPAQKYALILWDHGLSWKAFGIDQTTGTAAPFDWMYMGELRTALTGQSFELIGFDACLMASIEVADQIQPFTRYMVASEEQIKESGWPYDGWVSDLRAAPGMDGAQLGTAIVSRFDTFYNGTQPPRDDQATLSCLRMSAIPALIDTVSSFAADLRAAADDFLLHDDPADNGEEQIHNAALVSQRFTDNNVMDLHHFAENIVPTTIPAPPNLCYRAHLQPVLAQTTNPGPVVVVAKHGAGRPHANGLSIHMPLRRTSNRDGATGLSRQCESPDQETDTYDCPSWSRETDGKSRRAAYATNVDLLPRHAEDVEKGDDLPGTPATWPLVPSPGLRFVIDTQWDEFLQRYYHPVSDNHIEKAVCPDGRTIDPVVNDPVCGNPVDQITIYPGCTVYFHGHGSSDADINSPQHRHWMWDFDDQTNGCGACIAPYELAPGALASDADDDMNAEHDYNKAPLNDEKEMDIADTSHTYNNVRDYLITLHAWDDNHIYLRHNTSTPADHVHPQTDDHTSIVHVVSPGSIPGAVQGVGVGGVSPNNISWKTMAVAQSYDVVKGDLRSLRLSGGNFTVSLTGCVENDSTDVQAVDSAVPSGGGQGFFYLVRGTNAFGQPGTYDTGLPGQVGSRDAEIQGSPAACP